MSKRKQNNKNDNYIEELKESLRKPGKPKVYGIFIIAISLIYLIPLVFIVVDFVSNKNTFKTEDIFFFSIFVVLFAGALILQVIAGIRRIKGSTGKSNYKRKGDSSKY